jgi:zinc and cadmium transporter
MNTSLLLVILSAGALPALAILALLLRRNLFKGALKYVFLTLGLILLGFAVFSTFLEHGEDLGWTDALVVLITSTITFFILSKFNHGHTHDKELEGAKGIVISESFHSLIDGAVIGATYLVSPLLGTAATLGIIAHELPKIIGTLTVFRGLGLSIKKTILYGILAQIGSPVAAILMYLLGKQIDHEQFHSLEIASVTSLAAIVLWIIYLEIKFHERNDSSKHDSHSH